MSDRSEDCLSDCGDGANLHGPLHRRSYTIVTSALSELEAPLLLPEERESSSICQDDDYLDFSDDQRVLSRSWVGPLMLLVVSFLFATLNVSLRSLYLLPDPPSPSALSATRGWLTLLMFVPFVGHRKCRRGPTVPITSSSDEGGHGKSMWRAAAELSFWNFLGQALYNWGIMQVSSSARASFLGQTTVVMIPLICALAGEKLKWSDLLGCLCSFLGLILLSKQSMDEDDDGLDSGNTVSQFSLGVGDVLILASAFCWSFYIIKMSKYGHAFDEVYLQGSKNTFLAILFSLWFLCAWIQADETSLWKGWHSGVAWAILTYTAIGPGVLADLIQQKGQQAAGPTESNLILCVESAFTAVLGRVILGEETSWVEKMGGGFLIAGAVVSGQ